MVVKENKRALKELLNERLTCRGQKHTSSYTDARGAVF